MIVIFLFINRDLGIQVYLLFPNTAHSKREEYCIFFSHGQKKSIVPPHNLHMWHINHTYTRKKKVFYTTKKLQDQVVRPILWGIANWSCWVVFDIGLHSLGEVVVDHGHWWRKGWSRRWCMAIVRRARPIKWSRWRLVWLSSMAAPGKNFRVVL